MEETQNDMFDRDESQIDLLQDVTTNEGFENRWKHIL